MTAQLAAIIPAYGLAEVTHAVVRDCATERGLVDVLVVDNMGDYQPVAGETVIRPGTNLGWLKGTNFGFEAALRARHYHGVIALNNDTRLSRRFFHGLWEAHEITAHAGLVAPCYDDVVESQRFFLGNASQFSAEPWEGSVSVIDGTCFLVSTETLQTLGPLDSQNFGRRGWGAIEDYCIRTRRAGKTVTVTRRAYLNHARGSTAHSKETAYERYATSEFRRGMRRKWGRDWALHFEEGLYQRQAPADRVRDWVRHLEDSAGLSNTWIGRRT